MHQRTSSGMLVARFCPLCISAAILLTLLLPGCGAPSGTTPAQSLKIWRDPDLDAKVDDIRDPFDEATPAAIPVNFVPAEFADPLPHEFNLYRSEAYGMGSDTVGQHVSNKTNWI